MQRAIDEKQEADLLLDVVRTNGQREERRVLLALDGETLRQLIADQEGEQIHVAIDPESLATSFDDVEAHGLREAGAALAIAVTAVAGGAGMAAAAVDRGGAQADPPNVQAGMPRAMPSDYAQSRAGEQQMPRAMPSDYAAAAGDESVTRGTENVRASQPPPAAAPDPTSRIESVRVGGTAIPDASTTIENVRAERAPVDAGDGGAAIAAPSTGVAVAIAGGAMLTIAAAAFAVRRKREPGLA